MPIRAAALLGIILGSISATAQASWVVPFRSSSSPIVRAGPPDQSWLMDVPDKSGAASRGKVAVFVFKGDDVYEPVRATVVRLMRKKGLNVTATLRPVDTDGQYREMSHTLNLAVFVEGEISGDRVHQKAVIHLRSGVTGRRMAAAKFSGPTRAIVAAIQRKLWAQLGPATIRACSSASRPRRREREPLRIDAGTPLDSTPLTADGT